MCAARGRKHTAIGAFIAAHPLKPTRFSHHALIGTSVTMTVMITYLPRRDLLRVAETTERSSSSKWRAAKAKRARALVSCEPRQISLR